MTSLRIQIPENDGVDAAGSIMNITSSPRRPRRDVSKVRKMLYRSSPKSTRSTDAPSMDTPRSKSIKPPLHAIRGSPDKEKVSNVVIYYGGSSDITPAPQSPQSGPNSPSSQSQGRRFLSVGSQHGSGSEAEDSSIEKQEVKLPPRVRKAPASFSYEYPEKNGSGGSYDLKDMSTPKTSIDEYDSQCLSSAAMSDSSFEVPPNNEIEISKSIDEMVMGIDQMIDADLATLFQRNSNEALEDHQQLSQMGCPLPSFGEQSSIDKGIQELVAGLEEVMKNGIAQLGEEPEVCMEDIVPSKSMGASKDSLLLSASIKEEVRGMTFHTALKNEGGLELSIQTNLVAQSSLTASIRTEMSDVEHNDEIDGSPSDCDVSQSSKAVEERVSVGKCRERLPREPRIFQVAIHCVSRGEEQSADFRKNSPRARHCRVNPRYNSRGDSSTSSTGPSASSSGRRPSPFSNSRYSRGHPLARTRDCSVAASKPIVPSTLKSSSCSKLSRERGEARKFNFETEPAKSGEYQREIPSNSSHSSRSDSDRNSLRYSSPSLVDILTPSPAENDSNTRLRAKSGTSFDFNHDCVDDRSPTLRPKHGPGDSSPQVYDKYLAGGGGSASGELEVKPSDSYLPDVDIGNSADTPTRTNSTTGAICSGRAHPRRPPKLQMHIFDLDSSDSSRDGNLSLDSVCVFEKVNELKVDDTKLLPDPVIDEVATLQQRLAEQNQTIAIQKLFLEHQAHTIALLKMERDLLQAGMVRTRHSGESQAKKAATLLGQLFASCNTWSQHLSQQVSQRFVCAAYS
jgi:hypothetical protein